MGQSIKKWYSSSIFSVMHSLHNRSSVSKFLYLPISIIRGCALILILQIACLTLKSLRNVYFSLIKCSLNVKYVWSFPFLMILKGGSNWLFPVVISVEITLSRSHSGNSFEFSHRLTCFLNYALFCLSFCLRLNLKPVNYLTMRRSSKHGQAWPSTKDLFYPFLATQQKTTNHTNIECSVYLMFKVCCWSWWYMNYYC